LNDDALRTCHTILLTGGRAPAALELARLFRAAGHRVILAESFGHPLTRYSRTITRSYRIPAPNPTGEAFIEAIAEIVRKERVDLLVPTCEEIFHLARGHEASRLPCELFAPAWPQLRLLHSKWDFIRKAEALGFPVPRTWKLESRDDLQDLARRLPVGERFVLKPVYSRFSTRVQFFTAGEPLPDCAPSSSEPWVVQAFVTGRALCTYGIARAGRLTAHAAYAADFTAGQGACINFAALEHPGLLAWVQRFVEDEAYTGQIAFDFIETPEGILLPLECNPRATSGVHLFTARDRLDRAILGTSDLCVPRPDARAMVGLAMLAYGLPAACTPARLCHWIEVVGKSRDVAFRLDDPMPFLHQFVAFTELLQASRRSGTSMLAASTRDIEWNG